MKVLWLVSWYPNRLDKFTGDFIQRHAQAVSQYADVEVLFVKKDEFLTRNTIEVERTVTGNLTEHIIYYNSPKTNLKIIDRVISFFNYKKYYQQAVEQYIKENGRPAYIHVHVAMKAGLIALWAKRKYNIPFLLTEHWGDYLEEAVPNIKDYNFVYQHNSKKIITSAVASTFVSASLQKLMIKKYAIQNTEVIPNVVNTDIFYPVENLLVDRIRFIHISSMVYQKNPEAILEALALLKDEFEFEMLLYGPVTVMQEDLIVKLGLQEKVLIKGEVTQDVLAKSIQQCDALILYSRFETFGCVLIEANACGIPVIVSNLEVFHEIVVEGVNGIFAAGENSAALAEKLKQFALQRTNFDKNLIAATAAEKYNYKKVGEQFLSRYKNINN
jgi:glycosyltransferase involved in cell wall biosynthesis